MIEVEAGKEKERSLSIEWSLWIEYVCSTVPVRIAKTDARRSPFTFRDVKISQSDGFQ